MLFSLGSIWFHPALLTFSVMSSVRYVSCSTIMWTLEHFDYLIHEKIWDLLSLFQIPLTFRWRTHNLSTAIFWVKYRVLHCSGPVLESVIFTSLNEHYKCFFFCFYYSNPFCCLTLDDVGSSMLIWPLNPSDFPRVSESWFSSFVPSSSGCFWIIPGTAPGLACWRVRWWWWWWVSWLLLSVFPTFFTGDLVPDSELCDPPSLVLFPCRATIGWKQDQIDDAFSSIVLPSEWDLILFGSSFVLFSWSFSLPLISWLVFSVFLLSCCSCGCSRVLYSGLSKLHPFPCHGEWYLHFHSLQTHFTLLHLWGGGIVSPHVGHKPERLFSDRTVCRARCIVLYLPLPLGVWYLPDVILSSCLTIIEKFSPVRAHFHGLWKLFVWCGFYVDQPVSISPVCQLVIISNHPSNNFARNFINSLAQENMLQHCHQQILVVLLQTRELHFDWPCVPSDWRGFLHYAAHHTEIPLLRSLTLASLYCR